MTAFYNQASLLQLAQSLGQNVLLLSGQALRLCQAEMRRKMLVLFVNLGLVALGGMLAFGGLLTLLIAAAVGLSQWMSPVMAVVTVGLGAGLLGLALLLAGLLALRFSSMVPRQSLQIIKENAAWLKDFLL